MAINLPIISEWNPAGIDKAIADFKKLETNGQKASFAIKKAAVPAGLAIAALGAVAFDAVKAFAEDDAAAQKLATTLRNTTGATDAQVASVEAFISETSRAAAVADDELRPAFDKLVRGTGDVTKAQDLMGLALNISAGTGKDLGAVSDALSKAFNGQLGPLKKLDPALADLIKSGATTDEVFAAMSETFAGQADTAANTTQGKMKNLGIQMGELKESIGQAVLPLVEKMLPALQAFSDWASENKGLIVTLGLVIGGIATAIIATNAALAVYNTIQALTAALNTALTASFSALWVATGAVVILAIIAALVALQVKFDIFGKAIDGIKAGFMIWWGVVKFVFGAIKSGFEELKDLGEAIFDGIGGAFKGVINGVISALEKGLNFAIKGLNTILDGIDKAAGPFVNFGEIPEVNLPRLAQGGIVTGPTIAMIGEGREPEAVIPLSQLGSFGVGGGANITVNVNGGDPNQILRVLQQYVRQSGPLPINTRAM
jgi:phage-related protein